MEIRIKKLSSGFFVNVIDEEGETIDQFAATGRWNLYPKLSDHLFSKEENERASNGKKDRSKKTKKKASKRKL